MAKASAARVFFDVVGSLQAHSLIRDAQDVATVQKAIFLDSVLNITEQFDLAAQAIHDLAQMATDAFYEYDMQLVRVKKFYNDAAGEVEKFAARSVELGEAFAFSGEQALAASSRTAQLKGILESQLAIIEATRAGLLMSAVGEMETELGMNRFIALAQQTGFLYGNLTKAQYDLMDAESQANIIRGNSLRVLDQLNTIENSSVATMEDITFVLNQFASQADIAGESIGDMAAMSALLLETGEEVSRAGTGLRMIYQRIGNENSEAVRTLQQLMGGVDASVITQMKLSDILKEIAPAYETMTAEQKRSLAVNIAGSRHYVKFLKLMENSERLTELQTAALEGQYTALEEFGAKAESAAFRQQQLDAAVKNVSASIGENLADAFMQADRSLLMLLSGVDDLMDKSGMFETLVSGAVGVTEVYRTLLRPITETGATVLNTVIAFKTLQGVRRAMTADAKIEQRSRAEQIALTRYLTSAQKDLTLSTTELRYTNRFFYRDVQRLNDAQRMFYHEAMKAGQALEFLQADYMALDKAFTSGHGFVFLNGNLVQVSSSMENVRTRIRATEGEIEMATLAFNNIGQKLHVYNQLMLTAGRSVQNFNVLQGQGIKGMQQRVQAQQVFNETLQQFNSMRNDEYLITVPLTAAQEELAVARIKSLRLTQAHNDEMLGNINSAILLAQVEGKEVPEALIEQQQAIQANRAALEGRIDTLEQGLFASRQTRAAIQAESSTIQQSATVTRMGALKTVAANTKKAMSYQKVSNAMLPMTMLVPMLFEGEEQMAVMMALTTASMLAQIPALTALNAKKAEGAALSTAASGGLNLLAAAVISAGVAFAAVKFNVFKDPLDDLTALNEGIGTLESNIAGIMSREGAVLPGVVEESYGDLAGNSNALSQASVDLQNRLNALNSAMDGVGGNKALQNSLQQEIDATQQAINNINDLTSAIVRNARIKNGLAEEEFNMTTGFYMKSRAIRTLQYGEQQRLADDEKSHLLGRLEYQKDFYIEYTNMEGEFVREEFEKKKDFENRKAELEQAFSKESLSRQQSFIEQVLTGNEGANADIIASDAALYDTLLGQANDFANAREELFFGQRANFTGALFKQVSQGGVENLLYKTEIVQTNIFNGMTLPEMVREVAGGVVTELRNQGVNV